MIVYIYTFPNGKKYIGQTTKSLEQRAQKGKNYKSSPLVYYAIQKYGWDNIEKEIIECQSEEELDNLERELIAKYKTTNINFGYNIEDGGNKNKHLSEETKKKLSDLNKGENHPMYGICRSKETKKKISEALIGKERKFSEKWKENLSKSKTYSVMCIETQEIFESTEEAGKKYNRSAVTIGHAASGIQNTAAGYHWRYINNNRIYETSKENIVTEITSSKGILIKREELKNLIRTIPFTKIGLMYDISEGGVRRWCDKFNLPRTKKEIKSYTDKEWELV